LEEVRMKYRTVIMIFVLALAFFAAAPAKAHFQMLYTPEIVLDQGGEVVFKIVFTHPFEAGHTMDMGPVEEFYVLQQRGSDGEPKKIDLKEHLKEITWKSLTNSGKAYEAVLPKNIVRSMGDYVFVLVPSPYLEKEEDSYIQQITKVVLNVGGQPGNWSKPVGLPAEILPYDKPYANWAGGVFRGAVLSEGKPVPGAELEIEYMNYKPDMKTNSFQGKPKVTAPHDAFVTMGAAANPNGEFILGLAKAGWWGICALGAGPAKEYNGKELSQDAVLWVKAVEMK
jgi:cobalt/nickel transport protein